MKILLLSNVPSDFEVYDRSLTSKIHNILKKELRTEHVFYLLKGSGSQNKSGLIIFEMPFMWRHLYQKIAGMIFIIYNNMKIIKKTDADLIWIEIGHGFSEKYIFIYPLLFQKKRFYIETTTPSVDKSKIKRYLADLTAMLALKPFKHIGVGNIACKDTFKIPEKKVLYPQVGFPAYSFNEKKFNSLNLIYLGTLDNRDIWKTIVGLEIFLRNNPDIEITYDIIGSGYEEDVKLLKDAIKNYNMNKVVTYHGFQPTIIVEEIIKKCNIGVAFVPIVEYYDTVSITKALEYFLAGMPVIATRTSFAKKILKSDVGVLCDDTPEAFALAIREIYDNTSKYNSCKIRELYKQYEMSYTIKEQYIPMLESILRSD